MAVVDLPVPLDGCFGLFVPNLVRNSWLTAWLVKLLGLESTYEQLRVEMES